MTTSRQPPPRTCTSWIHTRQAPLERWTGRSSLQKRMPPPRFQDYQTQMLQGMLWTVRIPRSHWDHLCRANSPSSSSSASWVSFYDPQTPPPKDFNTHSVCPLTQENPILSEAATFQNNGKRTNPSRHPAVMSGNSAAALIATDGLERLPNDLLAFSGTFTGASDTAPPIAHPPKHPVPQNPGMVWVGMNLTDQPVPPSCPGSSKALSHLADLSPHLELSNIPGIHQSLSHHTLEPAHLVLNTVAGTVTRTLPGVDNNVLSTGCCLCSGTARTLCLKFLVEGRREHRELCNASALSCFLGFCYK